MSQRKTRKAGLPQVRHQDPKVQRSFDALIERVEVIDGLRGDPLDKAVTYRDLSLDGFTIITGRGGSPQITNTPGTGDGTDGPGVGPAAAPQNLSVTETFLALLAVWQNPSFNLQHIEVWRSLDDNLSTAQLIGTTVSPQYLDYVGALATYYYWVRAVGTDGTYSAYNDTAGTVGTTGIDPSAFEFELNISGSNLDAALAARIDLIDVDTLQDSLMTRVAAAEGDIVTIDARTTSLESSTTGLATSVSGNTTSINANASLLATQQTSITTLLSDLGIAEGDIASNAASIAVNASDVLSLQAAVGALDSSGGQDWDFLTTVEGFTVNNATLTHSGAGTGAIIFTPNAANPQLVSPTIGISGGIFTQVVMRVRQTIAGGTWEGSVMYTTGGHSASSSFIKTIPDPAMPLSTWTTLTWDMSDLTSGGADWESSTITGLRFDLVSDNGGKFEIDWIIIAKFSTTALSDAISALDVRVTVNENDISAQSTDLTVLTSRVDNPTTGLQANADALTALTTTVTVNQAGLIAANAAAITALDVKVYDPTVGAVATSTAFAQLQTDVSTNDGVLTAQASDITQLVARIGGGYASLTNSLTGLNANFGTSYTAAEIQPYADIDGRTGVAARINTTGDVQDNVYDPNGAHLVINPNGIYEVKFSVYHDKPTNAGSFFAGLRAHLSAGGGTTQNLVRINNRVAGSNTSNAYWLKFSGTNYNAEWLDVTCYILGSNVNASLCPRMRVNGSSATTGFDTFFDGYKVVDAPYVFLRFLNFNSSPSYGDDTSTTTYVTNLVVHRIDSAANNYAAIQTEATVTADAVGDLNALYAVKVQLNTNDVPYISGFGLAADVINGVATSAFGIRADQFFIVSPSNTTDSKIPFSVGLVDGSATVGINGQLIVDGTIRGTSIVAGSIGAAQITVTNLSALSADMGTLTAGLIRTAPSPAFRVEIQDAAATTWPLWYGKGTKSTAGRFYVDNIGNVTVKGLLSAGMIEQSYFTPGGVNSSFRIACDYPNNYTGGVYSGKKAHLNAILSVDDTTLLGAVGQTVDAVTRSVRFYGPAHGSAVQYGRLGSYVEMLTITLNMFGRGSGGFSESALGGLIITLQYRYDDQELIPGFPTWTTAFTTKVSVKYLAAAQRHAVFITKPTAFNHLDLRLQVTVDPAYPTTSLTFDTMSFTVSTLNLGIADITPTRVVSATDLSDLPTWPQYYEAAFP